MAGVKSAFQISGVDWVGRRVIVYRETVEECRAVGASLLSFRIIRNIVMERPGSTLYTTETVESGGCQCMECYRKVL